MTEENKKGDVIAIRKQDLWKYSTFALLGILIIGAIYVFTGAKASVNGAAVGAPNGNANAAVNLDSFLENPDLYPSLGPENADNVVIEFSDFQCPYCALASGLPSWTAQYQAQYGDLIGSAGKVQEMAANGELRFIYVPMSFLGQESKDAVEASLCANDQDKFWEMHDAIFAAHDMQENNGKYTKENLKVLAQGIEGIDMTQFNECLDSGEHTADVQTIATEASKAASGTPTFYVNGQKMSGSWTQISAALA